jgi:hypothetical protein
MTVNKPVHYTVVTKTYGPEDGDGELQCTTRPNGRFELAIFHNNEDITLYDLTRAELLHVGRLLQSIASPDEKREEDIRF